MGIVKIYNVLGGFYENYNTMAPEISVHKLAKKCENILCKMRTRLTFQALAPSCGIFLYTNIFITACPTTSHLDISCSNLF